MKAWLALGCTIALVAVAACNGEPQPAAAPPENQAEPASNVAAGQASSTDIAAVMRARHDHYEKMGKAMKGLGDQLKSDTPSIEAIRRHAALISGYGPQILTWFPEGSGPEAGRTRAKAEVWTDAATFRQRAQEFEAVSARFNRTAQVGDLAAIGAGMRELGTTCKNCHDRFRVPEHD